MPGRRNPVSLTNLVEHIHGAVHNAKANAHDIASITKSLAQQKILDGSVQKYVDLQIQFIGASNLPKLDIVGSADPYFVAKLDDRISFVSTVKRNTLSPVWNEIWRVQNVPAFADLFVEVLDKDDGAPHDDYIGKFNTTVSHGAKEVEIEGPMFRRSRGTFWLKIDSQPSSHPYPHRHLYTFDGPIRYSRHFSPTVGLLTNLNDARLYSTWKMYIRGVPLFLNAHEPQHWNRSYKAAQNIFQGPASVAVRSGIQAGHRMLYARSTTNGFGIIESKEDIFKILKGGASRPNAPDGSQFAHRIKPAVYTYIISLEDDSFRFSETGAAFFVDFASKHALHANCAEAVRYSGEFHPRPAGGWDAFSDDIKDEEVQWEVVIDNNSGTYAPDPMILPDLKTLFEYNFKNFGFNVVALDRQDEELTKSREACRAYALSHRGVKQEELQPHAGAGEETLSSQARLFNYPNDSSTAESTASESTS